MSKLYENGQWSDMSFSETAMSLSDKVVERTSNEKFLTLVNKIKDHFTRSKKRGFRDTQFAHYRLRNGESERWLSPDITFWGKDTNSFPETSDESSPTSKSADFKWCIAILEGKLDRTRKDEDDDQLGSYVQEVFSAQLNRRFIPSFIFTQSMLKFFLFDHSGVLLSYEFNYHTEPKKFVGIIRSLLEWDEGRLGFDRTITREEEDQWIISTCPVDEDGNRTWQRYIVVKPLFHSTALVGDCPTCWLVKKEDDYTDDYYFIKDAWVFGGSSNEGALLKRVCFQQDMAQIVHHEDEGSLLERVSSQRGIAQIVYHEDVRIVGSDDTDSILNNRPRRSSEDHTIYPAEDRVHSRIVMHLSGRPKPLEQFSYREELLFAFRDAIAVGTKSIPNRGDDLHELFPAQLADRLGSRAFQALRVVDNEPTTPYAHNYINDLESFYYTFCYMVTRHSGPMPMDACEKRDPIDKWFSTDSADAKIAFLFKRKFPIQVPDFFGNPVKELLEKLHVFFCTRVLHAAPDWTPTGATDYEVILEYFDDAIAAICNGPATAALPLTAIESGIKQEIPQKRATPEKSTEVSQRVKRPHRLTTRP